MANRRPLFKKPPKGAKQSYLSKDMKKKQKKERASRPPPTKYQRSIKHIERGQEAIQAQKRQIEAERKYRQETNTCTGLESFASSDSDTDEGVDGATFEDLAVEFNDQIGQMVDSAEDSTDEEEESDDEVTDGKEMAVEASEWGEELECDNGEVLNSEYEAAKESHDEESEESHDEESIESQDEESEESQHSEDEEIQSDDSNLSSDDDDTTTNDPYMLHTAYNLSPAMLEALAAEPPRVETSTMAFSSLGNVYVELPKARPVSKRSEPKGIVVKERYAKPGTLPTVPDATDYDLNELYVKDRIVRNMTEQMDALQRDMFAILNGYHDLHYPQRSFENANRLREVYCLHALNHVLKAVSKIQHHTIKLTADKTAGKKKPVEDQFRRRMKVKKQKVGEESTVGLEFRDQGFVRPKVLIIVPFRESALQCVSVLKRLFAGEQEKSVLNWKRFTEEYGGGSSLHFPRKNPKPADYERTFAGNIDDNFRLGIAFNRSTMKLYAKYYSSDVIIASPLGLRMAIGAKGEKHRDYDFLASIELLIIDQAEICYAQNWDHVLHVLEHLHHQPKSTEYTEFSRVREWCLNGWSKFYRQTVLLSAFELPEFRWLYNKHFHNYRGKVRSCKRTLTGTIKHVAVRVPQNFQRVETTTLAGVGTARFSHFLNVVLPQARTVSMARCLIYVPSYFDFVRLRNYFKKEELSFTQICEYTTDAKIARARDMFFHGSKHFLLYSERAHFFRRHRIRGIRHLILYAPPVFPHFYPELVNLMMKENQNPHDGVDDDSMTVTVLYTGYDTYQLAEMVGAPRAKTMIKAPRSVHRFTTDQK
ncbi:U3 small nucleolar RNA-associated protein 25 homolog [Anopheles marshallii]|uniref:U3 small nucleolar RNA-associated protein 25 homolog n=1 Tax=Anopheles marshallii TaxID=1521116 RepID=UPI00237B5587|nr:U3 small nucleolar RNA-associated protein 25 homolog [Anopheles marshallii]